MRLRILSIIIFLLNVLYVCGNDFYVTVTTDGNAVNQLRGAVAAAEAAGPGPHTIHLAAGTYDLTMGQISFGDNPITIHFVGEGADNTIINMTTSFRDRIFRINPTATVPDVKVSFDGIRFQNGLVTSDYYGGGAILCGGPSNEITITNCVFEKNSIQGALAGTNGGALSIGGGGKITIDHCSFIGNATPVGDGGAIFYSLRSESGSFTVTHSYFHNNAVTNNYREGGAIAIDVLALGDKTTDVIIRNNYFSDNVASGESGVGGAIAITYSVDKGKTAYINYNHFYRNGSRHLTTKQLGVRHADGNVDATYNWWGCNRGPQSWCSYADIFDHKDGATGTLILSPWLQLDMMAEKTEVCASRPGDGTTITAFFRGSNGEPVDPSNLSVFIGKPVVFRVNESPVGLYQRHIDLGEDGKAVFNYTSNGMEGDVQVQLHYDEMLLNEIPLPFITITKYPRPEILIEPSDVSICPGNRATFSVAVAGENINYAWYHGDAQLVDGTTATGSYIEGSEIPSLSVYNVNEADAGEYYAIAAIGGCSTQTKKFKLELNDMQLTDEPLSVVQIISDRNPNVNSPDCERYVTITPAGGNPVNGTVQVKVDIASDQPAYNGQPYVKRYYNITPTTDPHTKTANITLYFRQSEFDSYNAARAGTEFDLPTGPDDMKGRSNLRVTQYHGTGTTPGTYTGWPGPGPAAVLINPGAENVVWNDANQWWEVTFPVTGFSGFFVTGLLGGALPVTIQRITASPNANGVLVEWQVADEVDFKHYEVQTSHDGTSFTTIGMVPAANKTLYNFLHTNPVAGNNYYRLKLVDIDGNFSYSRTVVCQAGDFTNKVGVLRNPFAQNLQLRVDVQNEGPIMLQMADQAGRLLLQKTIKVSRGLNTITLPEANGLAKGIYALRVSGQGWNETVKLVKTE